MNDVTRSVEFPDEAVDAAAERLRMDGHSMLGCGSLQSTEDTARAALLAALPYLAPAGVPLDFDSVELRDTVGAEVFRGLHGNGTVHFDTDIENNAMRDWTNYFVKSTLRALKAVAPPAPAGDGGLREALAELAADWRSLPRDERSAATTVLRHCGAQLASALAAHPAAPAVPQPADERPLRAALERYFSNGGPDTPIRTTWHEGVEHWEAPAEDIRELIEGSAVPQPVDREAIVRALSEHKQGLQPSGARCSCGWTERPYGSLLWTPDEWRDHLADAVLAVLAGEQEQVEP